MVVLEQRRLVKAWKRYRVKGIRFKARQQKCGYAVKPGRKHYTAKTGTVHKMMFRVRRGQGKFWLGKGWGKFDFLVLAVAGRLSKERKRSVPAGSHAVAAVSPWLSYHIWGQENPQLLLISWAWLWNAAWWCKTFNGVQETTTSFSSALWSFGHGNCFYKVSINPQPPRTDLSIPCMWRILRKWTNYCVSYHCVGAMIEHLNCCWRLLYINISY